MKLRYNIALITCLTMGAFPLSLKAQDTVVPPTEMVVPTPTPAPGVDPARVDALEEQVAERDAQLAAANGRLEALEARAAQQDAAATEAEAEPEEEEAPLISPLASVFTRYEHREGYDALRGTTGGCGRADGDCIRVRARLGFNTRQLDIGNDVRVAFRLSTQVAGFWQASGGLFDVPLGLHEGYLDIFYQDWFRLQTGRFEMVYGDHLMIGNVGWHPVGRTFDGFRAQLRPAEGVQVDLFWTLLSEGNTAVNFSGDRYFYGAYAALGPALGENLALDVYAFADQRNRAMDPATMTETNANIRAHVGSRYRHRISLIDLRAEGGMQFGGTLNELAPGTGQTFLAGSIDAEAGVNLMENNLRFALGGGFASGDGDAADGTNFAYQQFFPTAHKFLGLSDFMGGRSNVAYGNAHLMGRVSGIQLTADAHVFSRPEGAGYVGTELNFGIVRPLATGLKVRAMYAIFIPDVGDPAHFLEIEGRYDL